MKYIVRLLVEFYKKLEACNDLRRIRNSVANGLVLGKNVTIMREVSFDGQYPYLISIGDNCAISRGVRILAHDATPHKFIGYTRIGKVEIKQNCFIGEGAIILPGVTIGPNTMIAVGSMVNRSIPPNCCAAGYPARVYRKFDEFIEFHKNAIKNNPCFERSQDMVPISKELREKITRMAEDGDIYVTGYELPTYNGPR